MTEGPDNYRAKAVRIRAVRSAQFRRFILVGGTATILQYATLIFSVDVVGIPAVAASALSYLISAVYNYLASYYFTFNSVLNHRRAAIKYIVMIISGVCLNTGLFAFAYEILRINYLLSQVLASGVVLFFNFFVSRNWTFIESGKKSQEAAVDELS